MLGRLARTIVVGIAAFVALATAGLAGAQQTMAQYGCLGDLVFCEQDVDALDRGAHLTAVQREAVTALLRVAMERVKTLNAIATRKIGEQAEKAGQLEMGNAERAEEARKSRAEQVKASIVLMKETAAIEREALGDVRATLTGEQIEMGWAAFERYRRRILIGPYGQMLNVGHHPARFLKPLALNAADAEAVRPLLETYDRELDVLLAGRMSALAEMYGKLAETGEYDYEAWQRPEMKSGEIHKLNVRMAHQIRDALSMEAREQFMRQRVGVEFTGLCEPMEKDGWMLHLLGLPSLSEEQRARVGVVLAKANEAMYQSLLAGVRACDEAVLKDADAKEVRREFMECYRRVGTLISGARADARAVLTEAQSTQLDVKVTSGDEPGDAFKNERFPLPVSPWLAKQDDKTAKPKK